MRLWKIALQQLARETGLEISVCHFPPGTSKWNNIEQRLFSFISLNWRGRALATRQIVVNLIGEIVGAVGGGGGIVGGLPVSCGIIAPRGAADLDGGGGSFYLPGGDVASGIVKVVLGTFNHGRTRERGVDDRANLLCPVIEDFGLELAGDWRKLETPKDVGDGGDPAEGVASNVRSPLD